MSREGLLSDLPPVRVLGLGNLLCGDDGVGVAAVHQLLEHWQVPEDEAAILDGGTLGMALLAHLEDAREVILLDAVHADAPAGSFVRLEGDEVEPAVRQRLSVHQVGVADLLDALRLLGEWPERLVLLGVVPLDLDLHVGLSPEVAAALPRLEREAVDELRRAGVHPTPRLEAVPSHDDQSRKVPSSSTNASDRVRPVPMRSRHNRANAST